MLFSKLQSLYMADRLCRLCISLNFQHCIFLFRLSYFAIQKRHFSWLYNNLVTKLQASYGEKLINQDNDISAFPERSIYLSRTIWSINACKIQDASRILPTYPFLTLSDSTFYRLHYLHYLNSSIMLFSGGRPTQARMMFSRAALCLARAFTTGVSSGTSGAFVR